MQYLHSILPHEYFPVYFMQHACRLLLGCYIMIFLFCSLRERRPLQLSDDRPGQHRHGVCLHLPHPVLPVSPWLLETLAQSDGVFLQDVWVPSQVPTDPASVQYVVRRGEHKQPAGRVGMHSQAPHRI